MEEEKPINYKDEKGNILYGYSQESLEKNTKAIYVVGFAFLFTIIFIFIFLFWYIHTFNVLNNIVSRCI